MTVQGERFFPGATATPAQVLLLASEYRLAADTLMDTGRRGHPLSRAPYRFVAIHAIELYLNALLLATGHPAAKLRGLQHNLAARTELAMGAKLGLRKATVKHLQSLSETREYLITRYDPAASAASELTRLVATMREVAKKVPIAIARAENQTR